MFIKKLFDALITNRQSDIIKEPNTLFSSTSPDKYLQAFVLKNAQAVYLLVASSVNLDYAPKTCWVRNIIAAPEESKVRVDLDNYPALPIKYLSKDCVTSPINSDELELLWLPEGDGVILLENGAYLAFIPSWSGINGLGSYARDCQGKSPLCWEINDSQYIENKIKTAKNYWSKWYQNESPWRTYQPAIIGQYENILGAHTKYYAIDNNQWPPKAVVRFDLEECIYLLTVGISLRPQPLVDIYFKQPEHIRRFELGACFSKDVSDSDIVAFTKYISRTAKIPWNASTFFSEGYTVECNTFIRSTRLNKYSSILLHSNPKGSPNIDLEDIDGDRVNLLWAMPISEAEKDISKDTATQRYVNEFSFSDDRWPIS